MAERITLAEFQRRMARRALNLERNVNRLKQEYGLAIMPEIVIPTPVDTGLHTSRWQVGLGAPPVFDETTLVEGSGGSTKQTNNMIAIRNARQVIRRSVPRQTIFISNNGVVIVMLNRGWSKQAPSGYVQAGILRAVSFVRGKFQVITV